MLAGEQPACDAAGARCGEAQGLESVVLARLDSAPLTDAVPAVDGRDVEPGHRGVAVSHFTETWAAGCDAVRSGGRASRDVYSAIEG
jgi:hypothetical protein